ncbi:MAG: tetratricopeptide repeat protein [Pyrinomonadaceae bacterium]
MPPRVRQIVMLLMLLAAAPAAAWHAPAQSIDARLAAKFKEATEAQRAGKFEEAAVAYGEVVRLRPDIPEVYVNYGLVRYEQKHFADAVKLFEKALAMNSSLDAAHLFLGISYYSLNRLDEAQKALERAVSLSPGDARARMWLGVALMGAGKHMEAAQHLDMAAQLAPDDLDVLYHRGRVHLKLSQESYGRMFKVDPKSARVHQVLAQSFEESGREADAIAEYELAIKLAPTSPGIREALGSLYWKTADLDKAEELFLKELELDPHNTLAMYKLGSIRVERGKPEQGLPLLESAVKQNPAEIDAYYYLGKAQGLLGQPETAIVNLQKVAAGKPSGQLVESAYYQLSQVYRKAGRLAEARTAIEEFQKLKAERERQQEDKREELKKRTAN